MKAKILSAFLALLISISACKDQAPEKPADGEYARKEPQSGDGFKLYTERALFDQLADGAGKGQMYRINSLSRDGISLVVNVSYSAACADPKFTIVWDGMVAMIYPMRINMVMKLEDPTCENLLSAIKTSDIRIDLTKYVGSFAADRNTVFSVINAADKKSVELIPITTSN